MQALSYLLVLFFCAICGLGIIFEASSAHGQSYGVIEGTITPITPGGPNVYGKEREEYIRQWNQAYVDSCERSPTCRPQLHRHDHVAKPKHKKGKHK